MERKIAVIGASGAIGAAFCEALAARDDVSEIYAVSRGELPRRAKTHNLVGSLDAVADEIPKGLDAVIHAGGILHGHIDGRDFGPEKRLGDLDATIMAEIFRVNTTLPAMTLKTLMPKLKKDTPAIMALLSARVGSIGDNHIGGWYSYHASKAALNQIIRTASIEIARTHKKAAVIGLHPGTVDSALSKPFQGNVPDGKLFSPAYSAQSLLAVMSGITHKDSGRVFDWAGKPVPNRSDPTAYMRGRGAKKPRPKMRRVFVSYKAPVVRPWRESR